MFNKKLTLSNNITVGTGWVPSLPDMRDQDVDAFSHKAGVDLTASIPDYVILSPYFTAVENQGDIGSCTAHAATGIVEYYQKRVKGKAFNGSRRFVYKTTRNLMQVTGDTGAYLRNVMGALVLFGVPHEKYFPYTDKKKKVDEEPSAFVYSVADNFEALEYFCHDPLGARRSGAQVLDTVKRYIAAGIPSMFGFYGFPSFGSSDTPGGIPFPGDNEKAEWGHAIVACGYDDNKVIRNMKSGKKTKGALQIRNSWGTEWGESGYGWIPYRYVKEKLADDFWSILSMEWVDTKQFDI